MIDTPDSSDTPFLFWSLRLRFTVFSRLWGTFEIIFIELKRLKVACEGSLANMMLRFQEIWRLKFSHCWPDSAPCCDLAFDCAPGNADLARLQGLRKVQILRETNMCRLESFAWHVI